MDSTIYRYREFCYEAIQLLLGNSFWTPMIPFALSNNIVSSTGGPLTTSSTGDGVIS